MSKITIEHEGRICTVEQDDVSGDIYRFIEDIVAPALVGVGYPEALVKESLGFEDE